MEIKGTIVCRKIRGKDRFYHQWRENGKTRSRYLKPEEVQPLRERLDAAKGDRPPKGISPANGDRPLFAAGVVTGHRLKELTADTRRLSPREIFPRLWGADPTALLLVTGAARTGKTTLLKQIILTFSDKELDDCAYLSLPATLTAADFLRDLETLFDRGCRRFFIDGIDRSPALAGTVPVLADVFCARGALFRLTANDSLGLASENERHPSFPTVDTSRISFRDFRLMAKTDNLSDYLSFRGLDKAVRAHAPTSHHLGAAARKLAIDKLRHDLAEEFLRESILEDTKLRRTNAATEVLVPTLPAGGIDFVVVDHEELTCELYVVRYESARDDRQIAPLENTRNLDAIEHRYGTITAREVLYLGRNAWHHAGVFYRNAAAYLAQPLGIK